MVRSILLVGVGGQGTILASKILSEGLIRAGYDVKMSEIHGMSQRGGSVSTQVKFGDKVMSPMICSGEADVMIAFEKSEAVRNLHFLKKGGTLLINDQEIYSMPVIIGSAKYPERILERLEETVENVKIFDAMKIAEELGNVKAQNIVALGFIVKALGLTDIDFESVIRETVPPKTIESNLLAFTTSMNL